MSAADFDSLGTLLLPAVLEAGRLEMRHFAAGVTIEKKADKSPVTVADREAEDIILAALARVVPDVPVVAEEAMAAGRIPAPSDRYLLVDALDGTQLFIRGKPEFSINIALIDQQKPVFGLIYLPATGKLYVTRQDGNAYGATVLPDHDDAQLAAVMFTRLATRDPVAGELVAFNSRSTGGASADFLAKLNVKEARPLGSSMKFCLIAAGEGDLYARFGRTYEWDTAAGQAILEAAGGCVTTMDGQPLSYGRSGENYLNPHFIAWARRSMAAQFFTTSALETAAPREMGS